LAVAAVALWTRFRAVALMVLIATACAGVFALAAQASGGRAERAEKGAPPAFLARSICGSARVVFMRGPEAKSER
ncbi:MAG: hypothetical protein RIC52_03000, partial [Amphiplicatus sp.]